MPGPGRLKTRRPLAPGVALMRTKPPLRTFLRTFVSTNGRPPPARCAIYSAKSRKRAKREIFFRLLGFEHQQKQAEGTSGMHAVAGVPVLLCSLCALPARKEQGKARTSSSKGEGEQSQARSQEKQSKQNVSPTAAYFFAIGAKHEVAANQIAIASEKQTASSKQSAHEVRRRTK